MGGEIDVFRATSVPLLVEVALNTLPERQKHERELRENRLKKLRSVLELWIQDFKRGVMDTSQPDRIIRTLSGDGKSDPAALAQETASGLE